MRTARFLPLVLLLTTVACGRDGTAAPTPSVSPQQVSVAMPTGGCPGFTIEDAALDAVDAAADATTQTHDGDLSAQGSWPCASEPTRVLWHVRTCRDPRVVFTSGRCARSLTGSG
jgi:hypothetical protein